MANGSEKKWNRPWPMEEMIESAVTWSLAGDVALLNTLKAYSENLFSKTANINNNVDNLLHDLDEVGLKLHISQNEFQSLRNTQFIESRVYEDDETLEGITEEKSEEKAPTNEEKEQLLKESIGEGLRVMDEYFERVEVSISDSEDEEPEANYVLRPKDLYAHRPLPLVIGTEEWYKKWHVGLADSSSESESEKVSETYSDSESADDLPKDLMKGSETSSELDFSSRASENRPVANSTFNDSAKKSNDLVSDEDSEEHGSFPVKSPISSKSFAEQLAAKLGSVISEREDTSEQINRNPIQPAQKSQFAGDLFSDEPPPLDDLEDTILPKSAQEGLFSGGKGLFSDNEDEPFWGQKPSEAHNYSSGISIKSEEKVVAPSRESSRVSKGLFDSDSDDDMFSVVQKKGNKQPFLRPYATTAPLFDEEPPELDVTEKSEVEQSKKKPVGGVSIFGKSDIFSGENIGNILKSRQESEATAKPAQSAKAKEPAAKPRQSTLFDDGTDKNNVQSVSAKPQKASLFDDDDETKLEPKKVDLFDDGEGAKASQLGAKPKRISLFDDNDEVKPAPTATKSKKLSLFDEDDDFFKADLFSGIGTKKLTSSLFDDDLPVSTGKRTDLFSDSTEVPTEKNKTESKPKKEPDVFADFEREGEDLFKTETEPENKPADEVDKSVQDLPHRQVIGAEKFSSEKKPVSLFDEFSEGSDSEDLFKDAASGKQQAGTGLFESNQGLGIVQEKPKSEPVQDAQVPTGRASSANKIPVNLFGETPPPEDEDWDTKSDNFSDIEDQFSYRAEYTGEGSSVFDNEPPSLLPDQSSGIVRDHITRIDTADEFSFNPDSHSSRRLSSDIFNDEQSQDSFFLTKNNKTESISVPPPIDEMPEREISTTSNLEITPSGNMADLEGSTTRTEDSLLHQQSGFKKPVSLFDDEFNTDADADDLFSSISKSRDESKSSDKPLSLFDDVMEETKASEEREIVTETGKLVKGVKDTDGQGNNLAEKAGGSLEEGTRASTAVKDAAKTEESVMEQQKQGVSISVATEVDRKEVPKPTRGKVLLPFPGKLKHNLKINVGALMPGAAPPKFKELTKSQSLELPKDQSPTVLNPSSSEVGFYTPVSIPEASKASEKAVIVSFEDALDSVEVLHSVTKDRAKIPIKRRPSTRRGRQQAIQSGGSDFTLANKNSGDTNTASEIKSSAAPSEPALREEGATASRSVAEVGDGLFSKESSSEKPKSKRSIFASDDSDDELFGQARVKQGKKGSGSDVKKKSLFNDSSSDEELFASTGGSDPKRKEAAQKTVEKKIPKASVTRKLENIETDEDPLSSLLK